MNRLSSLRPHHVGFFLVLLGALLTGPVRSATAATKELYQLKIYHLKNKQQEEQVDAFLKDAYLPALHQLGLSKIGVFKPIGNDTAADRRIIVLIPFKSFSQFQSVTEQLEQDKRYATSGQSYWTAAYTTPPYSRLESILLESFADNLHLQTPQLTGPRSERVYELRSYESATERLHLNKVRMFVAGGEVGLFKRLGFNAVFYSRVLIGSHMPNLMYMTTFENKAARDEHWKNFGADPEWKKLSTMPEYQNNVSHIDQLYLYPMAYSDY